MSETENTGNEIAIIGMACRVPGAKNLDQFWKMLKEGNESIHRFSDEELRELGISEELIKDTDYVKANNILEENELFDAAYFGYSAREAERMDPQQRIFLEGAVEALNNAGIVSEDYEGDIGVFAGCGKNDYYIQNLVGDKKLSLAESYQLVLGNEKDFLTTRTAYMLGLSGPAVNVNTACSTSLVAIHTACQSILNGECDVALAGGVSVSLPQNEGYLYQEGMILSPDGKCRSFDAKAKGTIPGRGAGIVVLKPLEDALEDKDHIYAVIKGSAINNDGKDKVGFTAPSVNGQSAVIEETLEVADVNPETISLMEAHGTATPMGDPIEIKALTQAWSKYTDKKNYCSLGSLKSNIGHADAAAGVLGLIKTALSLYYKQIPASLHFETPNPEIDFENSPFTMNTSLKEWTNNNFPIRAAVSAFGIGGTNAHAILEEAPTITNEKKEEGSIKNHLLVLSAKSEVSLQGMTNELVDYLEKAPRTNLSDVANTLVSGRTLFNHRVSVAASNLTTAISGLRSAVPSQIVNSLPKTAFLFSGQGSQYVDMAKELYESSSVFKGSLDYCANVLNDILGVDIRTLVFVDAQFDKKEEGLINHTQFTQPILFSVEYSLAKLLKAKGVSPDIMIGHSIGEYTAACLAGVFTVEDALRIVSERGRLMQQMDKGDMLAVSLSPEEIIPWLNDKIELASVNSAEQVVVGGKTEDILGLRENLIEKSIGCQVISTSHAFHTSMMDPMLEEFSSFLEEIPYSVPTIPFVSGTTGKLITAEEATSKMYWVSQLRNTVQFAKGINYLLCNQVNILIEVGPGKTLSSFAKMQIKEKSATTIATIPHVKDQTPSDLFFLNSLGKFWQAGGEIDLTQFSQGVDSVKMPLPGYVFDRKRYWVDLPGKERSLELKHDSKELHKESLGSIQEVLKEIWSEVLGVKNVDESNNFFELGGDSLMAVECVSLLKNRINVKLEARHFVECPTIAELTGFIKVQSSSKDTIDSRLVQIKKGTSEIPLICIHPAGGTIFPFITMANYLPKEQSVYAIQSISLEEEGNYLGIKDRSKKYIDLIKTIQPEGPYHLSGWSFGGNVAVEMGIQLTKNGDEVTFLGLFDSFPSESYPSNPDLDNVKFLISFVITISEAFGVSSIPKVNDLYAELNDFSIDECWEILSKGIFQDPVFEMQKLSSLKNLFEMFKIHVNELCSQELEKITIPITLFNAKDGFAQKFNDVLNMNTDLDFVLQCWENYSDKPINHFEASGNHSTMLNDPHVKSLALKLSEILENV